MPPANPPSLSAKELFRILLKENRRGNRARYKFASTLLTLRQTKLFRKLGYSSIAHLAGHRFRYSRSKTYESLRVAQALRTLERCRELFLDGKLTWSDVRAISRVASAQTEADWIAFAEGKTFKALDLEVRKALHDGRKAPRKDGHGLPNLNVTMTFELTPEEHDLLVKALEKAAQELEEILGNRPTPVQALLYLAQRLLETDLAGLPKDRVEKIRSINTILYHICPECRDKALVTKDGPVEVPDEHMDLIEGEARKITIDLEEEIEMEMVEEEGEPAEIDPPNSAGLVRKVLHRDGCTCANPHCGRKLGLHAHHIKIRCKGGKTALFNEITVCATCHACLHRGFLILKGNPVTGLIWIRAGDAVEIPEDDDAAQDAAEIARIEAAGEAEESTTVDSKAVASTDEIDFEKGVRLLEQLGHRRAEAHRRVECAIEIVRKRGQRLTEDRVYSLACSLGYRKG